MTFKVWNDNFSVNNPTMDADHQKMTELIGHLHELVTLQQNQSLISLLLNELVQHAKSHFCREEQFLGEIDSGDLEIQSIQHELYLEKVRECRAYIERGEYSKVRQIIPFLNNWFLYHVETVDMKYKQ